MPLSELLEHNRLLSRIRNARYRAKNADRIQMLRRAQIDSETPERKSERIEKRRAGDRRRYALDPEKVIARKQADYWKDPERWRAHRRKKYQEDPESNRRAAREWRVGNLEYAKIQDAARVKANPEYFRAAANRYRARKAKAEGDFTPEQFRDLCAEYGNRCASCRESKSLHADHVVPLCKGGSNFISNIQPLCKSCNSKKATKIILFPRPDQIRTA